FFDAQGNFLGLANAAEELRTKLGKLSDEGKNEVFGELFGTDAIRTALALMKQGGKGIDEMLAKLKNTDSAEIAATRVKGLWGEIDQLKSAVENLSIAIGKSGFLDFATNIVIKLTDWTQALATLNPEILKFGTIVAGLVASIGPLLFTLGLLTRGFGITLQGLGTLIAGFRNLAAALLFLGANPIIAALALVGVTIGIWATRASEATAALRVHESLIGKVGTAYDEAGRKVGEMTQQLKDQALIAARQSQDVAQKALPGAIDEAIDKIEQFDGLLPHAADGLFELFKQFRDTRDIEAFREAVASVGAQSPELGTLAQQFLDITQPAHDLNVSLQESLNWIGLYTGKINDSQFAAQQAALGIAGWKDANKEAETSAKDLGTAVDETKTKVEGLSHQITVFRGGGDKGVTSEVFNVVDGVAKRVEDSKKALDDVSASAETAGEKVKQVANDLADSIRTVPDALKTDSITPAVDGIVADVNRIKPAADAAAGGLRDALGAVDAGGGLSSALTENVDGVITELDRLPQAATDAVGGLNSALAGIDTSGAQQAATAVAQPFQQLPSIFSQIFSGLGSLIQGGFGNLTSVIRSLAGQIRSEINSIIAALRQAVAQAQALRAQAASSSSSSSGGGSQGGFAGGGVVRGPGGPRTDSILARLSNGEFVIQARAVQRLGVDFLNMLNHGIVPDLKGLRGFKLGGFVDGFNQSMSIPRLATGGLAALPTAAAASSQTTGMVPLHFSFNTDEIFEAFTPSAVASRMRSAAVESGLLSTGRKPTRK
ncbi:MAG: phage tail tape measure protein, partial [Mesorhizobium sp.]